MDIQQIELKLPEMLSHEDFEHSLKVKELCQSFASEFGCSAEKLAIAGLLHDCGKIYNSGELISKAEDYDIPITEVTLDEPVDTLHGPIGAIIAKEMFGIVDSEILTAIKYHTFGANEMTLFSKILFVADKIVKTPNGKYYKYSDKIEEIQSIMYKDIDSAVVKTFNLILTNLIEQDRLIYSQIVNSRNKVLLSLKQESRI